MLCMGFISQLRRIVSSAIFYAHERGYELDIRSICYGKMVDRRETDDSEALSQLIHDVSQFAMESKFGIINVSPDDEVMIVATELLRFGSKTGSVKKTINKVSSVSEYKGEQTGVNPKIVPLKEAFLDNEVLCECAGYTEELLDEIGKIRQDHGNHVDPSIGVSYLSNDTKRQNEALAEMQGKIYQGIRDNNSRFPSTITSWLDIRSVTTSSSSTTDTTDIHRQFVTALASICNCGIEHGALKHSTEVIDKSKLEEVGDDFMNTIAQENTLSAAQWEEHALYFRKSPGGNTGEVAYVNTSGGDGEEIAIPLYQLSWTIAYLEKFHKKEDGRVRAKIYYDHNKTRDGCNPALMALLLDTWKHNIIRVIAHKVNRLTSHLVFYQLLKYIWDKKGIQMGFPYHHGKDIHPIVKNENDRKVKEQKAYRTYISKMNTKRNELSEKNRKISSEFLKIGSETSTENDKHLLAEILKENHLNSPLFTKFFEQIEDNS